MVDDSIEGIYDTLEKCAIITKAAGNIGLNVHNIRAKGTRISGINGIAQGLIPMLKVYNDTACYIYQGKHKKPGEFAIYLEPWHADIFDYLNLKKETGESFAPIYIALHFLKMYVSIVFVTYLINFNRR